MCRVSGALACFCEFLKFWRLIGACTDVVEVFCLSGLRYTCV